MRITDLLKKSGIALGVKVADKSEAIDKLVSLHEKCGNLKDVKAYISAACCTRGLPTGMRRNRRR